MLVNDKPFQMEIRVVYLVLATRILGALMSVRNCVIHQSHAHFLVVFHHHHKINVVLQPIFFCDRALSCRFCFEQHSKLRAYSTPTQHLRLENCTCSTISSTNITHNHASGMVHIPSGRRTKGPAGSYGESGLSAQSEPPFSRITYDDGQ